MNLTEKRLKNVAAGRDGSAPGQERLRALEEVIETAARAAVRRELRRGASPIEAARAATDHAARAAKAAGDFPGWRLGGLRRHLSEAAASAACWEAAASLGTARFRGAESFNIRTGTHVVDVGVLHSVQDGPGPSWMEVFLPDAAGKVRRYVW